MSLLIRRSDWFIGDLEHYAAWYQVEASWEVAQRYLFAVSVTLARLGDMPGLGRLARFPSPALRDLRSYPVERPFEKHLMFYRHNATTLDAERVIHGARNLPRRLTQPPAAEGL
jgi:plasmid stabilization system protein ParE